MNFTTIIEILLVICGTIVYILLDKKEKKNNTNTQSKEKTNNTTKAIITIETGILFIIVGILVIVSISTMLFGYIFVGIIILIISSIIPVYYKIHKHNENVFIRNEIEMFNSLSSEGKKAYYESKEIDYTILVGGDSKKSVGSAIVRGAVGSALLGPIGLVCGAISGKNKSETTFTVVYKDGHREVKTVGNDSSEFRNYASYLR